VNPWKRKEVIGNATLYLGDCLEILPTLPKVDAVITSPPYNQLEELDADSLTGIWGIRSGAGIAKGQFVNNGYADGMEESEYQAFQNRVFSCCVTHESASLFYNHQLRWRDKTLLHPISWFHPTGWHLRSEIVWNRGGGMMMNARMFCRFDERILWFDRGKHKWNQSATGYGTVWNIARAQNKEHPVAFPLEIPTRCIGATTDTDDACLDPFMGSGTTGVACMNLGRKFIGVEIEERYFDIACGRITNAQRQETLFQPARDVYEQVSLDYEKGILA